MPDPSKRTRETAANGLGYGLGAFIVVAGSFVVTVLLRMDLFMEHGAAKGIEATYHVLWTAFALGASDPAAHLYLPTVTLHPDPADVIGWGATVPSFGGALIYTSFPPLSFVLFAAILDIVGRVDFMTLALANAALGFVAALAMGGLAREAVLSLGPRWQDHDRLGWFVFTFAALGYLFMPEAMISHGPVVWAHSLSQIVLIAGCWLTLRLLTQGASVPVVVGLALVAALYPSLEWTGFIFNAGLFLTLAFTWLRSREHAIAIAAACVAVATIAAGVAFAGHVSAAIGLDSLVPALTSRAAERAYTDLTLFDLPKGYIVSFGALLPLAAVAALRLFTARTSPDHRFLLVLFVASFPMLENAVMMQHAAQFPFDRLKLGVPLLLLCAMALVTLQPRWRRAWMVLGTLVVLVGADLLLFYERAARFAPWRPVHAANMRLVEAFREDALSECRVMGTNGNVRGYLNFSLRADIREWTTREAVAAHATPEANCAIFVQTARTVFTDLPEILAVEIYDAGGALVRRYGPT